MNSITAMKEEKEEVRIDKWLWSVRLFKTRTLAIEACKKGRIMINNITVKPSRMVKRNEVIQIKKSPIVYSFQVVDLIERRVGAKLVPDYMKDVTPASEYQILEMTKVSGFIDRARGTGRPTKKDRRDLEQFTEELDFEDFFDFDN